MSELAAASGPRWRVIAVRSGYVAFFLAVLFVALLFTFPTRELARFAEAKARDAGVKLSIGALEIDGIAAVTLRELDVTLPRKDDKAPGKSAAPGAPAEPAAPPLRIQLDTLSVDVGLWGLLGGETLDVSFDIESGPGSLEGGEVTLRGQPLKGKIDSADVAIERIDKLPLGQMGLAPAMLSFQDKLRGGLDGLVSGTIRAKWGGSFDELTADVDLTVTDTALVEPEVDVEGFGAVKLATLEMGTLQLKVRADKKGEIAILKSSRGSDKSTAIAFEGTELQGPDIALLFEDRSHVLVPKGRGGLRAGQINLHFAFSLLERKDKGAGEDDTFAERVAWPKLLDMAGKQVKPFMRNKFLGITCTGMLSRPNCKPAIPQVTTGTARGAPVVAPKEGDANAANTGSAAAGPDAGAAAPSPAPAPPPPPTPSPRLNPRVPAAPTPRVELKPAVRDTERAPIVRPRRARQVEAEADEAREDEPAEEGDEAAEEPVDERGEELPPEEEAGEAGEPGEAGEAAEGEEPPAEGEEPPAEGEAAAEGEEPAPDEELPEDE